MKTRMIKRSNRSLVALSAVAVVAVVVVSVTGTAASSSGGPAPADVAAAAQAVIAAIGPDKVGSISSTDSHLMVGVLGTDGYTATQTAHDWYAKLAAAAVAARVGGLTQLDYADPNGRDMIGPDQVYAATSSPSPLAANGCTSVANNAASSAGVTVVSAHTYAVLGGACDVTITADDPTSLVGGSVGDLGAFKAALSNNDGRAFLLTVVDGSGEPIDVSGWIPNVGGDIGQGIGWRLPSLGSPGMSSGSVGG
jgi:hypothetical protein